MCLLVRVAECLLRGESGPAVEAIMSAAGLQSVSASTPGNKSLEGFV